MAYVLDRMRTRSKTGAAIWSSWRTTHPCWMPIRPEYGLVVDLWLWLDWQLDPISVCRPPARSDHTLHVASQTRSYFVACQLYQIILCRSQASPYHTFVGRQLDQILLCRSPARPEKCFSSNQVRSHQVRNAPEAVHGLYCQVRSHDASWCQTHPIGTFKMHSRQMYAIRACRNHHLVVY